MVSIKLVCLNLWYGGKLVDNALDFLKKEDADILHLQEVYNSTDPKLPKQFHSIELLRRELPYKYYDFAPSSLDKVPEGKVEIGNAVFSKFPITGSKVTFFNEPYREREAFNPKEWPTTPRNLQHVTINANGQELNVFNFQGVWDMDGDNNSPERQRMSDTIIKAIAGKPNVILGGDTNARPTNPAMIAIANHLRSVFGSELKATFNMQHKDDPGYASAAVDMIFVSPDIQITKKSCPNVNVSDHLPLVIEASIADHPKTFIYNTLAKKQVVVQK